jgi:HemY protein
LGRLVFYLIMALVLATGIGWLADNPGHVSVEWRNWRLETSLAILVFLGLAVLLAITAILVLWAKARRGLPFVGANRELRRQSRGLADLERAALMLAKGDGKGAQTLIERAKGALPAQSLTQLFAAQASLSIGDFDSARKSFKEMVGRRETEFLGLRGLLQIALQSGRETEALALAAQIWALVPKSVWATRTFFQLLTRAGDWTQAESVLPHLIKLKALAKGDGERYMAAVLYEAAREADLAGQSGLAQKQIAKALKADQGLVPAAVLAARLETAAGRPSAAAKILKAAWSQSPHPELAEAYAGLDNKETPGERYRRFKSLIDANPDLPLSRITLAAKALLIEHHEETAALLKPLLQSHYAPEALAMMAEVERGKGGPDAEERAKTWLERIADRREKPAWVCSQCSASRGSWVGHCDSCGAFASHRWQDFEPQEPTPAALPSGTPKHSLLPEVLQASAEAPLKTSDE